MAIQLLPELYEPILAHISNEDTQILCACSLVSTAFRHPAQKRLFSFLRVPTGTRSRSYAQVAGLFAEKPHMAGYVTNLRVILPSDKEVWRQEQPLAESIFRQLVNVRKASIRNYEDEVDNQGYELHAQVLSLLLRILESHGTLQHLTLWCLNLTKTLFRRILSAAPSLTFVEVATYLPESSRPAVPFRPNKPIIDLCISQSGSVYTQLCIDSELEPCIRQLRTLEHHGVDNQEDLSPCFLSAATLERLELKISSYSFEQRFVLPPSLPSLCELILSIDSCDPPPGIITVLSQNGVPSLTRLQLTFQDLAAVVPTDQVYSFTLPALQLLDEALDVHSRVRQAEWHIRLTYYDHRQCPEHDTAKHVACLEEKLQQHLPKAFAKGLIVASGEGEFY
ncbi:hypothetical protein MIND_01112800 [Mycena indigotica]|uniref:F-box domain-containing protein n=1 Tax=Mycena indigotica TaxID=2126181 RepID=A0A8H6SCB9_9AGAR|nr:uncharacterized protein MIND_01112800 [Mycena indigotica]KAF7295722.1 hypothetical protein MIND_01112800 [Mycena indigotica]